MSEIRVLQWMASLNCYRPGDSANGVGVACAHSNVVTGIYIIVPSVELYTLSALPKLSLVGL